MSITVQDNPAASRYELWDEDRLVGFANYRKGAGQIAFTHTEVDEALGGRGYGGRLVGAALDDAAAQGLRVLPYCPFVSHYIRTHPGYLDLVPQSRRAAFQLA
jgi:predicted GNAT family acetyltransferase